MKSFRDRVAFAAHCYRSPRAARDCREFDFCFEMYDGDFVQAALWRMSKTDPALRRGIDEDFSSSIAGTDRHPWEAPAERLAHIPTAALPGAAVRARKNAKTRTPQAELQL